MPIVNFSISDELDREIKKFMRRWGFVSKAEFFRFVTIHYLMQRKGYRLQNRFVNKKHKK